MPHPSERPLSPFMLGKYYRFQISSFLSILHRITGFGLTLGLIPLTIWLWGCAFDPKVYMNFMAAAQSTLGQLFLFGWTLAFYYHLGNGMRHLNWDLGNGFTLPEVTSSGRLVIAFALSLTIFTWAIILRKTGAFA